ncbi:MAG: hypothetical protein KBD82_18550 [Rhodoferax sp.]|uniref:terminase small subunit-like protein n=1 Tax=Rhodoferax sp. TaxID=50421 RepID=UPI001B64B44D|nr:hypothetical protein [Rhodoferax sp.]MBP9737632.1 hypothetical protein [Rhodoferax sp.]
MEKAAAKKSTAKKTTQPATKADSVAPKKVGAPTKYTEELADEICSRIGKGKSLVTVVSELHIDQSVVYDWLRRHPKFAENYTRAREIQADFLAEEIIAISEEKQVEVKHQGEDIKLDLSATIVQHNRLRVDARKWYASKLAPKKYGDKLDTTLTGPDGGPVQHCVTVKFV